jgi:hypothetical protein
MNRLEIAFLKNCDLETQKTVLSNPKQWSAFLKIRNFKRLTYDFKGQTVILPNA